MIDANDIEKIYPIIIKNSNNSVFIANKSGDIKWINSYFRFTEDNDSIKEKIENIIVNNHNNHEKLDINNELNNIELDIIGNSGNIYCFTIKRVNININKGIYLFICNDITDQKRNIKNIRITSNLLKIERDNLEEKNYALKELIENIKEEKNKIKYQIKSNVEKTIYPLLDKIIEISESEMQSYLILLKRNINEITSPFINTLENKYNNLSPREIEICQMIKSGYSSKEIATILKTSIDTIKSHRRNIRKKLCLITSKVNLVTFLQKSFSDIENA